VSALTAGRWRQALLLAGVLGIAANLRPAITSVSPVLAAIGSALGLGGVGLAVLATIPIGCFALLAPASLPLQRRVGLEPAVLLILIMLSGGLLLRLIDAAPALYLGTAIAGSAIAMANVLVPAIVKRDFPNRVGLVTGLYITTLYIAAATAAGVSVPLMRASALGWRAALGFWAIPALGGVFLWLPQVRHGVGRSPLTTRGGGFARMIRNPLAWAVTMFMGLQSLGYYGVLSWLPSILHSIGIAPGRAGLMLSISTIVALPSTLITPLLAVRGRDQRGLMVAVSGLTLIGYAGLTLVPGLAPWVWIVIIGLGQGAMFPLAMTLIVLRAGGPMEAMALSAFAQTIGYAVSVVGPLGMGVLHTMSGVWWPSMAFLTATLIPTFAFGLRAARSETLTLDAMRATV
jgi:CP family cyanate transporter-like MFS transporter